ncbi:MAG TPA: hypothetical protein VGR15_01460, partial [Bacteroidota bacterium]|nr:hypothetical protein [Bacteroidota bacterium]
MYRIFTSFIVVSSLSFSNAQAQSTGGGSFSRDSTIVFGTLEPTPLSSSTLYNSLGVDIMVSTNGFGLGTFYRHEYSDELSGFID